MVIEDSKGNMFNVDLILEVEHDPTELRLLAKALYEKLILAEEENSSLKGILTAKENMQQGSKVLTSKEYKEKFNLKGSTNARSK